MQKYQYKNTDIEWLGEIPQHWKVTKIKNEFNVIPSNVDKKSYDDEDEVKLCNYVDVYYNNFIDNSIDFMIATATDHEIKKFQLKVGDILITKDSEDPFDIAVPALIKETEDKLLCGYHLSMIRSTINKIDGSFLFWCLKDEAIVSQLYREATGVTRWAIASRHIKNTSIAFPPPFEQKAIVNYLDLACGRIDTIIKLKKKQLKEVEKYYDSKIHELITKGLDKDEPLIDSGIDWQGNVPKSWKREKLYRLSNKMGSGGTPKSTNPEYYFGDIPWIQSGDLNDGIVSKTKKKINDRAIKESSAKMFEKGTVLIAMYGATIGKLGMMDMDAATNQACCAIQVGPQLNSEFIFYLLYDMRKYLIAQSYGGGQPNISQEVLKQQYFYFPKKEKQILIVENIKLLKDQVDKLKKKVKKQIETLTDYRKSLIHECVTGKKQVSDIVLEKQNKKANA